MKFRIGRGSLLGLGLLWVALLWVASSASGVEIEDRCLPRTGSGAREEAEAAAGGRNWISWQLREENDFLAVPASDEAYTQGLLITLHRDPDRLPCWVQRVGQRLEKRLLPGARSPGDAGAELSYSVELGQYIFSPEDLERSDLILADRPYAGYLYGGVVITLNEDRARPVQHVFELQAGFVGPETGAEAVQSGIHELNDSQEPLGWDNQLPFEPGLNLFYLRRQKIGTEHADFVPHWGAALGSFRVSANAGFTLRWGNNLSIFPDRINEPTAFPDLARKWEGYLFAGIDGRLLGHNVFLDGTVFSDSHSVDKESFVYDLKAGFSVRRKKLRLTYTYVRRSRELATLPAGQTDGEHGFGSVSVTFEGRF